ncbi:early boundary activity protein 1-like [Bactrocera tryoni]|uniref:early boundary activity protein 1-like n=1 Tax=Bactrocera tryoni TaxID=59916 RepID=UPI001A964B9E|nr:early boundary activity protein 1-like [Bactrocera tryoni]
MDSAAGNFDIKIVKIESIEITPDLPHQAESKESVDRSESESKKQQQSDNEGTSIADLQLKRRRELCESKSQQKSYKEGSSVAEKQLKRRREFEAKFNLHAKKSKRGEYLAIAEEESSQDEVKAPMIQIPLHLKGIPKSRSHDLIDVLLPFQSIKKEREAEQNTTSSSNKKQLNFNDLALLLPKRMGNNDADYGISHKSGIKAEPIDDLDTSNTLNSAESLLYKSLPPFLQRALDTVHGKQSNDGFEIGPHGTWLSIEDLKKINWTGVSVATRSLLSVLFDRQTLARSTLTGNPSPAFPDHPVKKQLDPRKIQDIIYFMKRAFHSKERDIRNAITMKCADTSKANRRYSLSKRKLGILF